VPKKRKPSAPLVPLTGKQKSFLRSLAHKLKPVVQVGHQGVTEAVLAALDVALERHELVKLKVSGEAELEPTEIAPEVEKATKSQLAQIIGHTLVLYRRHAESPKIVLPRVKPAKAAAGAKLAKAPPPGEADDDLEDDEDFADEDEDEDLE
jgi:RNA-binding protein